jgi:hypothetical protein
MYAADFFEKVWGGGGRISRHVLVNGVLTFVRMWVMGVHRLLLIRCRHLSARASL